MTDDLNAQARELADEDLASLGERIRRLRNEARGADLAADALQVQYDIALQREDARLGLANARVGLDAARDRLEQATAAFAAPANDFAEVSRRLAEDDAQATDDAAPLDARLERRSRRFALEAERDRLRELCVPRQEAVRNATTHIESQQDAVRHFESELARLEDLAANPPSSLADLRLLSPATFAHRCHRGEALAAITLPDDFAQPDRLAAVRFLVSALKMSGMLDELRGRRRDKLSPAQPLYDRGTLINSGEGQLAYDPLGGAQIVPQAVQPALPSSPDEVVAGLRQQLPGSGQPVSLPAAGQAGRASENQPLRGVPGPGLVRGDE